MKLCKDCEFCGKQDIGISVMVVCTKYLDRVDPIAREKYYYSCQQQREDGAICGIDAKHFEQKKTLRYRILKKIGFTL